MTKLMGFVVVILFAWIAEASALCSVPLIREFGNQTVDGRMAVSSGDRCAIRMRSSTGPIHSVEIVQRPANGTVVIEPPHRTIYRSRPGYVGNDSFTYARRGLTTGGSPVVRTVRVNVTVVPKR